MRESNTNNAARRGLANAQEEGKAAKKGAQNTKALTCVCVCSGSSIPRVGIWFSVRGVGCALQEISHLVARSKQLISLKFPKVRTGYQAYSIAQSITALSGAVFGVRACVYKDNDGNQHTSV